MLTTVETVITHLKGIGQEPPEDHKTLLERYIRGVSDEVENYCRRTFGKATYASELHTGVADQQYLYPKQWPMLTLTSVTIDGTAITEGTDSDNWRRVYSPAAVWYALFREETWESDPYGVALAYTAGYVLPADHTQTTPRTLPYDLENAVVELAAGRYLNRGRSGLSAESFEGLSITPDRWPLHILRTLGYYQTPRLPGA